MAETLSSFGGAANVLVVGANGGIGSALVRLAAASGAVGKVHTWSRTTIAPTDPKIAAATVDILDETSIARAVSEIKNLHLVIVATGVLHDENGMFPEKTYAALDAAQLMEAYRINAVAPAMIAKHVLPLLTRDTKSAFCCLSARVGSISDNRLGGWYGYRASKAALNQIIKTLAIELKRSHPEAVCLGLHPGTVKTALSQPFGNSLRNANVFSPDEAASHLLGVINGAGPQQSGALLAWDGTEVPA